MVLTICSLRTFLLPSLFGPKSLGHGSRRAAQPPPTMLGHGSAVRESMLGHGSAARKVSWGTEDQYEKISWGTEDHCDSPPPALVAPSPRRPFGVLCSSVPQSDFHSHPPLAEDAPSFWASPSDLRHRVVARSLALLSRLALALAPSLSPPRANVAVSVTPGEGPSCCWRYIIGLGTY